MSEIFNILGISDRVKYEGKRITKKAFYMQGNLSKDEENIFTDYIDKIEISYVLTPRNININTFIDEEHIYTEVGYFKVYLKVDDKVDKISKIIQSNIPSPVVLIFEHDNNICLSTAMKRINKNDKSKVIIEDINITDWIDMKNINDNSYKFLESISLDNLEFTDFYDFYRLIDDKVYTFKNINIIGTYEINNDKNKVEDTKAIIEKINAYNEELKKIVAKIKKESQFNKKMKLNIEANNMKKEIDILKKMIN